MKLHTLCSRNVSLKIEFIAYIKILNIKIIFNFGIKTVLYLKYNRIKGLAGV